MLTATSTIALIRPRRGRSGSRAALRPAWLHQAVGPCRHDGAVTEEQADTEVEGSDEPSESETWQNPFTAEFEQRKVVLEAMPGFQIKADLEALGRAGHVMYENAEELSRHAEKFLQGRRVATDLSERYEKELVRYLHNYLTSIYSLIEAQRVVMRHCWGENSEFETGEYSEHRKASFETGEAEFMTELRNYSTHRSVPLPGMSTTFLWQGRGASLIEHKLTLDRDVLLKWKKWTAPAKAYLRAKEPQFDLGPVLASYVNTASAFFNWFVEEINRRNAKDKDEYLVAARELKEWYRKETGLTDEFVSGPAPGTGNRAERRGQRPQPKRTTKRKRRK